MSKEEKIEAVGIGREDLIASGSIILKELIIRYLDLDKIN